MLHLGLRLSCWLLASEEHRNLCVSGDYVPARERYAEASQQEGSILGSGHKMDDNAVGHFTATTCSGNGCEHYQISRKEFSLGPDSSKLGLI